MGATGETQRRRAHRKPSSSSLIRIEMKDGMGQPRWVTAGLVDVIDGGCGLELTTPLQSGSTVVVRGKLGASSTADHLKAGVRWCIRKTDGTFRAGLEFSLVRATFARDNEQAHPIDADALDCYEVMQLSPNADQDTISRVYRMLALRFHPDNAETGNSEMFIRLSAAYQILSNPEKRARYDRRHRGAKALPWKSFDQAEASTANEGEKRKRLDVKGGVKIYHRGGGKGEQGRSSVGALCGWNAALRCP